MKWSRGWILLISGSAVAGVRLSGSAAHSVERFRKCVEREEKELKASARVLMRVLEIGFPFQSPSSVSYGETCPI